MTAEYVDLESEIWTRRLKQIAIVKCIIKLGIFGFYVFFAISTIEVLEFFAPYVENEDLVLETALTTSQITAMILVLFIAGGFLIFSKMILRMMRR